MTGTTFAAMAVCGDEFATDQGRSVPVQGDAAEHAAPCPVALACPSRKVPDRDLQVELVGKALQPEFPRSAAAGAASVGRLAVARAAANGVPESAGRAFDDRTAFGTECVGETADPLGRCGFRQCIGSRPQVPRALVQNHLQRHATGSNRAWLIIHGICMSCDSRAFEFLWRASSPPIRHARSSSWGNALWSDRARLLAPVTKRIVPGNSQAPFHTSLRSRSGGEGYRNHSGRSLGATPVLAAAAQSDKLPNRTFLPLRPGA